VEEEEELSNSPKLTRKEEVQAKVEKNEWRPTKANKGDALWEEITFGSTDLDQVGSLT
jgi:hypothetical protein